MRINNVYGQTLIPVILLFFALVSCQKEIDVDLENPPPIPPEIQDSTLLVKSITYFFDSRNTHDSIVEHYLYDTANKKILVSWNDPANNFIADGTEAEFIYNDKGLLSKVMYNYPSGHIPEDYDYKMVDILYNAENIIQKISITYGDGSVSPNEFLKSMRPGGGYELSWENEDIGLPDDKFVRKVVFDANGKPILNIKEYSQIAEILSSGDPVYTKIIITDSLIYDDSGSVVKIEKTEEDTLLHTRTGYTLYEYAGRQTKGDQLYNQRLVLMNGVANIPFLDGDNTPEEALGILSMTLDYEYLQYSKHPIATAKAHMWDGSYRTFTASSSFDSKNRLIKFVGFFHDLDLGPIEYRINYYK